MVMLHFAFWQIDTPPTGRGTTGKLKQRDSLKQRGIEMHVQHQGGFAANYDMLGPEWRGLSEKIP
jgi:hypothetical protein